MKSLCKIIMLMILCSISCVAGGEEISIKTPKSITISQEDKDDLLKLIHETTNKNVESIQIVPIGHPIDVLAAVVDLKSVQVGDKIFELEDLYIRNDDWLNKYEKQKLQTDKPGFEQYLTERKSRINKTCGKWWVYLYGKALAIRYDLGDFSVFIGEKKGLNYDETLKLLMDINESKYDLSLSPQSVKWDESKKIDLKKMDIFEKKHVNTKGKDAWYWYIETSEPDKRVREHYIIKYINKKLTLTYYYWNHY
ncbi:MAG: hypothetical protein P9M03_10290 [Candidatus Theseobacter exili]|nr:hypothetical protein [Candidatus Theseobacter exili]